MTPKPKQLAFFAMHPLPRLALLFALVQGIYSISLAVAAVSVLLLFLFQLSRKFSWARSMRVVLSISLATAIFCAILLLVDGGTIRGDLFPIALRIWLFLLSIVLLWNYLDAFSAFDSVVLVNLVWARFLPTGTASYQTALVASAFASALRSVPKIAMELVSELRSRRLIRRPIFLQVATEGFTTFSCELLNVASEFHEEWFFRFSPKAGSLSRISGSWSILDLAAFALVCGLFSLSYFLT